MNKIVICNFVGVYKEALTRGKEYEVIEEDVEKEQIRIIGDNNRTRWYKKNLFVPYGCCVPVLVNWQFDDTIHDPSENSLQHVEVTITLSNGQKRWGSICTKNGIFNYIERNMDASVLLLENWIIVNNFSHEVVNEALYHLDQQNQLISSTKLLS